MLLDETSGAGHILRDVLAFLDTRTTAIASTIRSTFSGPEEYQVICWPSLKQVEITKFALLPVFQETGANRLALISESGLYKIVLRAQRKNPAAREFQDWVTKKVIPAIRKTGS